MTADCHSDSPRDIDRDFFRDITLQPNLTLPNHKEKLGTHFVRTYEKTALTVAGGGVFLLFRLFDILNKNAGRKKTVF